MAFASLENSNGIRDLLLFTVVQSLIVSNSLQPHVWQHTRLPCLSLSPEFAQIHVHWVGDAVQPSHTLSPPSPPTLNLSQHQSFPMSRLFTSGGQSTGGFSFSISPSIQYSGLIFFRIDWFDLLVVQGILMSLLQHHSSKASILRHSAFFVVHLSHSCMITGKTVTLTIQTCVSKEMSLLLNMLSRLFITFLPRSKRLLFHGCSHHL